MLELPPLAHRSYDTFVMLIICYHKVYEFLKRD